MPEQIYAIDGPILINFIEDNDLDGFKQYLNSDDTLMFGEPDDLLFVESIENH